MSNNIFKTKTNSRFDILNENNDDNKKNNKKDKINKSNNNQFEEKPAPKEVKINTFKHSPPLQDFKPSYRRENDNPFDSQKRKEQLEKEKIQREIKIKENREKEITEALKDANFPDFIVKNDNIVKNKTTTSLNFLEKITKTKNEQLTQNPNEIKIKPGFCEISFDTKLKKVCYKHGKNTYIEKGYDPTVVLNRLAELHQKRKEEYIIMWGEEEYEQMFRFPNYDYEFFDKLDEQYEEEMETMRVNDEENENDEYRDDYYY